MVQVFIGVEPPQAVATIEVVDDREMVWATGRFGTDKAGYAAMPKHVACYPDRVWAVEGSNGAGRPLGQRLLADRRDELSKSPVQAANRLHRLLAELVPGQSKKNITTGQTKTILATVRPRDVAGKVRRCLAAEQVTELVAVEKIKALTRELKELVLASGSTLMELPGVGPVVAARALADAGDVARFTDRNRFASWTEPHPGTSPDTSRP